MEFGTEREDKVGDYEYNRELNVKKARLNSTLDALLHDPILAGVPNNPTLSDVDTLISLELGSAMRLSVLKLDGTSFGTPSLSVSAGHFDKQVTVTNNVVFKIGNTH
jgi:U11/U12 small nuclear ribonucleoprotein SNRNP25